MTPNDRTRLAPPTDDQTRSLTGGGDTVDRPDDGTPSGVRAGSDPSATILRVAESHDAQPVAPSFEHYQLQGELGRGGMGVVYKALDTQFMRDVAIKVLSDRLVGNPTAERRFLEEARVTGQLPHTAIPPVHQIGRLPDGRQFLVMKLIKGRTLGERLRARANPTDRLAEHLSVLEQVCLGVGYAHSRGVIHRDLKPANIMVGAFGEVQVMDWGLAKEVRNAEHRERVSDTDFVVADDPAQVADQPAPPDTVLRDVRPADEEFTRAGTILGTPAYMSPEQASGDREAVGSRADVFSLGAVLCVVLTGQPPYSGKTANEVVLKAIGWETADAFRRLGHSTADPLVVDLCKRCLAKAPGQRPANGEAVAAELAEIRATAAERLRRTDLAEMARMTKVRESKRRRRWQLGLGMAVGCIVAMSGAAAGYVIFKDSELATVKHDEEGKRDKLRAGLQGDIDAAKAEVGVVQQRFVDYKLAEEKRKDGEASEKRKVEATRAAEEQEMRSTFVRAHLRQVTTALADVRKAPDDAAWDAALKRATDACQRAKEGVRVGEGLREVQQSPLGEEVQTAEREVTLAEGDREVTVTLERIGIELLDRDPFADRPQAFAERYKTAFQNWRQISELTTAEFARRVKEHSRSNTLVVAVFDWYHAADGDRKLLADLLDRITPADPFLSRWWVAYQDASPAGTKALLRLATSEEVNRLSPWVLDRVCCDLWGRGERDAAVRLMRDGVDRHPTSFRLHIRLALHLGTPSTPTTRQEAIALATAARTLRPDSVNAHLLLARLTTEQTGNPADALHHLTRGLRLRENSISLRVERAAGYARMGQVREAEADFAAAARFATTHSDGARGHQLLARIAAVQGKWAEAVKHQSQAVKLKADDPALWGELAAYHAWRLDSVNAVKALTKAIDLRPTDPAVHLHISWHHLRLGHTVKWLEHLCKACGLALPARTPSPPALPPK